MIYIAFILFTLLVLIFAFYQWQYFMIFSPTYKRGEELPEFCEMLSIISDDGKELEGVVYSPLNAKKTVLFFAGRSHDAVGLISKLSLTYPKTRIITFNYRSYGKSQGKISEKNLLNDGVKIAQLVQKHYGDFYLFGFSLGSSIAAYVASQHKTQALILVGSFDSIRSLVYSNFFPSFIFRYKFATGESIVHVEADSYLFASVDDTTTSIESARELKKKIKNLVYYKELQNLTHKELLWDKAVTSKIREVVE